MNRILIAGCGYVGTALGLRLAAADHQVWGLRREVTSLPPPLLPLAADLLEPSSLRNLPPVETVVYAASPDQSEPEDYRKIFLEGPGNLLAALENAPLRRFLFVSSTGVYPQTEGEWVNEDSPSQPAHFSGRILLEAENFLLSQDHVFVTILRLGGIYGPERAGLIERVRRGNAVCSQGRKHFTNRIHVEDAAAILAHLMKLDEPASIYLGVDSDPAEYCRVLRWLARQLGVPRPRVEPVAAGMPRLFRSNKRCCNRRLLESGYRFLFPTFREGYSEIIRQRFSGSRPA